MNGMLPAGIPPDLPADFYRSFLISYGISALARLGAECYKQIAILETAWYDVPTPAFAALEHGFIQHALLSFAAAEVLNMVLGALYKERVRQERDREWREWLRRKAEAERNDLPFNEPCPDEQPPKTKR